MALEAGRVLFRKTREELSISLLMHIRKAVKKTKFLRLFFNGTVLVAPARGYEEAAMVYRH